MRTRIPGRHHVYNCLAAAATAVLQGIDLATIARGLEQVQELPGRMNLIKCGQSFAVAVDEAASPFRLGVALHTLKQNVNGRVICVVGATHAMSPERASQFGRIAERNCDVPVITTPHVTGNRAVKSVNYEPFHRVLDGFRKPKTAQLMPDRLTAVEWALSEARPGDAVLIAGQGHRPIASLGAGRWSLTDAEVCQSWLYGESTARADVPLSAPASSIFQIDYYRPC